jgi:hypothetical protein
MTKLDYIQAARTLGAQHFYDILAVVFYEGEIKYLQNDIEIDF